jgi:hypothetical protein
VKHVDLKVQVDNPTGAVRLYKELGNARSSARRVMRALVGSNFTFL